MLFISPSTPVSRVSSFPAFFSPFATFAPYPPDLTAAHISFSVTRVSSKSTVILFIRRLTFTSFTPSSLRTHLSTCALHAAHIIPFTSNFSVIFITPLHLNTCSCFQLYYFSVCLSTGKKNNTAFAVLFALFYRRCALSSSPDCLQRYAGAMSNTVLQPLTPSLFSLYAALAYATSTEDVNSGLESSFNEYSITCLFSLFQPVTPVRITLPP